MRILLVSDTHLRKELGASKVRIELAEELERLGWQCELSSIPELVGPGPAEHDGRLVERSRVLGAYLREQASRYDVVDYGHGYLPFPRAEFPQSTLFVARSVLLIHHFDEVNIPAVRSLKAWAHSIVFGIRERKLHREVVARADITLAQADLVNVANDDDKKILVRRGIPQDKIVVIPYGLSTTAQQLFDQVPLTRAPVPTVAFVGTFDARKGAADFPDIAARIRQAVPEVRFRLVGTGKQESEVRASFPQAMRSVIDVVPSYAATSLPELLAPCSVGVFPSYVEGFGFGVLEMLAVGIPVIAYDAPGPPMMLPATYLVKMGDPRSMADKVAVLLRSPKELAATSAWAIKRARQFSWSSIARATSEIYTDRWRRRQARAFA